MPAWPCSTLNEAVIVDALMTEPGADRARGE